MTEQKRTREAIWEQQTPVGEGTRFAIVLIGAAIQAIGLNSFLEPLHLYSGGFMGYAQLINYLLTTRWGLLPAGLHLVGILYFLMNIPGLVLSWKHFHRRYVLRSMGAILAVTLMLSVVPVPAKPILDSVFANAVVAGILVGIGIGIILRMGATDGGTNTLAMIIAQKNNNVGIGAIGFAVSGLLYLILLFLFDIPTVIYSVIYEAVAAVACDRIHIQNINSQVMIVTKLPDTAAMEEEIMHHLNRGITKWEAKGAYTGDEVQILLVLTSKYEINRLRSMVHQYDPDAFIMASEGIQIDGNFKKRLT